MTFEKVGPVRFAPALLLLGLAACGGGKSTATLPSCVEAGEAIALPQALEQFPLPAGGVIDDSRTDAAGTTVFTGYVPGDLRDVRDFYESNLPKHGYALQEGDAEEHEAETEFQGHGAEAKLKLHDIAGCDGALTLEVGLR